MEDSNGAEWLWITAGYFTGLGLVVIGTVWWMISHTPPEQAKRNNDETEY